MTTGLTTIRAGFIPLTDAAPLIVARTQGFAEREGIDLQLSQETSWATIRDRLAVGQLDVAHALAPLPIAGNLGLGPLDPSLIVPAALGFGGNTIVMATRHWDALRARGCPDDLDPARTADAVADYIRSRDQSGERRLSLGVVHPHSAHRYKLAYWLASRGILAGRDVDFVVLPPPLMSAALEAGRIDGFCAGEPWGSVATRAGAGVVLTTTAQIWRSSPEKVLAVRTAFADRDADSVLSLVRAIKAASVWCDAAENRDALADTLSAPGHVAQPVDVIRPGLDARVTRPSGDALVVPGFMTFDAGAATFPWASHALWFAAQMARWGEIQLDEASVAAVRATYRPSMYRRALAETGVDLPAANAKVEGSIAAPRPIGSTHGSLTLDPDGFFDGRVFDPDSLADYLGELTEHDGRRPAGDGRGH